nr:hypothetical protein [Tanacetum cinerariifolium]
VSATINTKHMVVPVQTPIVWTLLLKLQTKEDGSS